MTERSSSVSEVLKQAHAALLRIRTASIAGCEEGYGKPEKWADELFTSHGDVTAAMKAIEALLSRGHAPSPSVDLMQRVWANLYYNEEDAGNTFQQTLNEVVDWLAAHNALPVVSDTSTVSPAQTPAVNPAELLDVLQKTRDYITDDSLYFHPPENLMQRIDVIIATVADTSTDQKSRPIDGLTADELRSVDRPEEIERANELSSARIFLREKPSTSYLQRKMSITYNRAMRLMEALENEGFISAPDSAGCRTVLVSYPDGKSK